VRPGLHPRDVVDAEWFRERMHALGREPSKPNIDRDAGAQRVDRKSGLPLWLVQLIAKGRLTAAGGRRVCGSSCAANGPTPRADLAGYAPSGGLPGGRAMPTVRRARQLDVVSSINDSHPCGACPRQDSNLRTRLRRPLLYPLSYGGGDRTRIPASHLRLATVAITRTGCAVRWSPLLSTMWRRTSDEFSLSTTARSSAR
jgi:hypothetical protein